MKKLFARLLGRRKGPKVLTVGVDFDWSAEFRKLAKDYEPRVADIRVDPYFERPAPRKPPFRILLIGNKYWLGHHDNVYKMKRKAEYWTAKRDDVQVTVLAFGAIVMGHRYDLICVASVPETEDETRYIKEDLMTRLTLGGMMIGEYSYA